MVDLGYRYNRPLLPGEQELYAHLLEKVATESTEALIERFRALFIDAVGYPEREISLTLDRLVNSKMADEEFRFVLNRCCHILINRWHARPRQQSAIPELVALLDGPPDKPINEISRARSARRVRSLVESFRETEQCLTLRRLAHVLEGEKEDTPPDDQPLGTLLRRYPYLFEHCLLSEDSSQSHQQAIRRLQKQVRSQFEIDLSQYITYRIRQAQTVRHPYVGRSNTTTVATKLRTVANPTLLGDRDLMTSIRQFSGRVNGTQTYRDMAYSFISHTNQTRSYRCFKDELYDYITDSVDPAYGKRKFNNLLHEQFRSILPDNDDKPLSDFLLVRTYSHILNFLVVESPQRPQHFVFVDLINNLGPVSTTALLLKIVLLCRKVRPYLERRFSILFNHYEACTRNTVQWLVQTLETLNIALSVNYGAISIPFSR